MQFDNIEEVESFAQRYFPAGFVKVDKTGEVLIVSGLIVNDDGSISIAD